MRLALAIAKLFASGGLQRDCLALAALARQAGHTVTLVTADLRGKVETAAALEAVDIPAWTRAKRDWRLGERLAGERGRFDRVVGFNKMPGLDVLYCADPPFCDGRRLAPLLPRGWAKRALEGTCFGRAAGPALCLLSEAQAQAYRRAWGTPPERIRVLPPTLDPGRRCPGLRDDLAGRQAARAALGVAPASPLWLSVAAVPRTKGVDRTVLALARIAAPVLAVAGLEPGSRAGEDLLGLARRHGVADRVRLLGHREDMPALMAAADLLVHPARLDTTGTVIMEAIVNGLPAVVSAACGYAVHVRRAGAGLVVIEPFTQAAYEEALRRAADPALRAAWSRAGRAYGADPALSSGLDHALALITGPLWGQPPGGRAG